MSLLGIEQAVGQDALKCNDSGFTTGIKRQNARNCIVSENQIVPRKNKDSVYHIMCSDIRLLMKVNQMVKKKVHRDR